MANKDRKGLRDYLWEYPIYFTKAVLRSAPVSYIVLITAVLSLLSIYAITDSFVSSFNREDTTRFVEGTVGEVSTYNPIYNPQGQLDKDVRSLLFERFIEIDAQGNPQPNIASSWEVKDGGLTYEFTISDNYYWHDGTPVTASDVVFTMNTAITLASQLGQDTIGLRFSGLTISEEKGMLVVKTDETNATLFEALNFYVVPRHLLSEVPVSRMNKATFGEIPTGSGPYQFVRSSEFGIVLQAFGMHANPPMIGRFEYRLFGNSEDLEVAFKNGELDAISQSTSENLVDEYATLYNFPSVEMQRRKKILFVNNRNTPLNQVSLRRGLSMITERSKLLESTSAEGMPTYTPFAEDSWGYSTNGISFLEYSPGSATKEFLDAGYVRDQKSGYYQTESGTLLTIKLTYLDTDKNEEIANGIKELWDDEGVVASLDPQSYEKLTRETLANRDFDILLYEIEITADPDQFDLWHSLRVDYPNLNISGYEFNRVDILLERGRRDLERSERKESYELLHRFLVSDAPVIFLYEPRYTYVVSKSVRNIDFSDVVIPSDRYWNISDWVIE
jgi:peptide/nickel transport system substrate-binding protein